MEVFKYLKTSKKHPFVTPGIYFKCFSVCVSRFTNPGAQRGEIAGSSAGHQPFSGQGAVAEVFFFSLRSGWKSCFSPERSYMYMECSQGCCLLGDCLSFGSDDWFVFFVACFERILCLFRELLVCTFPFLTFCF